MMKDRILVLTNNIRSIYSFRKEVIICLKNEGFDIYISGTDSTDNEDVIRFFEGMGCHIIKTHFNNRGKNPAGDIILLYEYLKLLKHVHPNVVLSFSIKPNIYGGIVCRLTRTPQIANITGLSDAVENKGLLQRMIIILYKFGLGKAKLIYFQNRDNKELFVNNKIADSKSPVLPGSGVNLSYHIYQDYPSDGVIKFLLISRILKEKGIEEYFEMAKYIKNKYPQTEFQILGWITDHRYKNQMALLESQGVVKYLGYTIDVRPFLKKVHATILPSYHEGLSNVNLESAANGRPVITTNVSGCRETVDNEKTGFLVKEKSVNDLIRGVEKFITLPYNQKLIMGKNARNKVEKEFNRQIVVNSYLDSIKLVIDNNRHS